MRAPRVQAGDSDDRGCVVGQQNLPGAGEWAEARTATGAIIVTRWRWVEREMHRADAQRLVGARQEDVEPGPLDLPVENELERPVFGLPPARIDMEAAVLEPSPRSREPQLGGNYLQIGKMDDAVAAALQVCGERRQTAGQALEEAVVEAAHPGL